MYVGPLTLMRKRRVKRGVIYTHRLECNMNLSTEINSRFLTFQIPSKSNERIKPFLNIISVCNYSRIITKIKTD